MHVRLCPVAPRARVSRFSLHQTRQLTRPSAPPYNATDDSPVRPCGRFTYLRQLTTWKTTRSFATVYNTMGDLPVRPRGRLSRSHWFIVSRSTHLSAPTVDPAVIDFSFTMVIIHSEVDNFWFNISGEIRPVYFYIFILLFFKKSNYSGLQVLQCGTSCLLQKGLL